VEEISALESVEEREGVGIPGEDEGKFLDTEPVPTEDKRAEEEKDPDIEGGTDDDDDDDDDDGDNDDIAA